MSISTRSTKWWIIYNIGILIGIMRLIHWCTAIRPYSLLVLLEKRVIQKCPKHLGLKNTNHIMDYHMDTSILSHSHQYNTNTALAVYDVTTLFNRELADNGKYRNPLIPLYIHVILSIKWTATVSEFLPWSSFRHIMWYSRTGNHDIPIYIYTRI